MRHTLQLNQEQQSTAIALPEYVHAIQVLAIHSNLTANNAAAQGIKFTIKTNTDAYSCFSFLQPATFQFTCFDVLLQLDGCTADELKFAEQLLISCEGILFLPTTAIDIELEIS